MGELNPRLHGEGGVAAVAGFGIVEAMPSPKIRLANPADAYEIAVMSRYLIEVGLRGWTWPPDRKSVV